MTRAEQIAAVLVTAGLKPGLAPHFAAAVDAALAREGERGCGCDEKEGVPRMRWMPRPQEGERPTLAVVYLVVKHRADRLRVRRDAEQGAGFKASNQPHEHEDVATILAEGLCARHQAASPTRQPCAACSQEASALLAARPAAVPDGAQVRCPHDPVCRRLENGWPACAGEQEATCCRGDSCGWILCPVHSPKADRLAEVTAGAAEREQRPARPDDPDRLRARRVHVNNYLSGDGFTYCQECTEASRDYVLVADCPERCICPPDWCYRGPDTPKCDGFAVDGHRVIPLEVGCPCAATTADRVDISRDGRCVTCPVTRHDEPAEGDVAGVALFPVLVRPLHEALCLDLLPGECSQHPGCELATDLVAALLASDALRDLLAAAEQRGRVAALREAADEFETEMGRVWGGDRSWLTTGTHIGTLVAEVLRETATERAQ